MHFYSIGYGEALRLPIPVFWELSKNIDRIKAENDLRQLMVIGNAIGGKGDYVEKLTAERGEIASTEDEATGFDRSGFDQLKAMMGRR